MSEIVLSGMRPTGALHLGHYVGVISNWLELQEKHKCYFFLADFHALTSNYHQVQVISESRYEYVKGWIASGIDPNKAHIYAQSAIPEVLDLFTLLLCLTPPGWADRSPSWKDQRLNPNKDLDNLGFYTYPILQTADIAIVKGELVPVGEDQVSHIEISREIVRKLNRLYKTNLPEPKPLLTKVPKLLGTDGGKMSSSKGNVITLRETPKSLQKKINKMVTDDQRNGIENPGNPDNCSVFDYHKIFSPSELVGQVNEGCRKATLGCGECKQKLGEPMKELFIPISEKMNKITDSECDDILAEGNKKVREDCREVWENLKTKIKF